MMRERERYRSLFQQLNGAAPVWVRRVREAGIARFAEVGFPTTRMEEWRYTSVAPIARVPFALPARAPAGERVAALAERFGGPSGAHTLVFVNGRHAPELSAGGAPAGGLRVGSLATALETEAALIEPHLARYASPAQQSFTALNTAFIEDGAFVHVPRGTRVDEPIHLLFISTAAAHPTMSCPRTLIVVDERSQAAVIESYVGAAGETYLTNAVTEVALGPNATLAHYKLQQESQQAFHVATIQTRQDTASRFESCSISLGGALVRTDINAVLDADGCACNLDGLYVVGGTQHVDHHTSIDHQRPHGTSRELYKGILDGRSTGVFNGKVYVRPNAQKSDAQQANKNLLLSEHAVMNTKPQLEIFADDVKCSHGATIGRLDEDALFYLRARGVGVNEARELLTYAFASEIVNRIRLEPIRAPLEQLFWARLRGGLPDA